MKENIIGRKEEKKQLEEVFASNRSEFVAVCGRRRVGKTFLIEQFFEGDIVFRVAGVADQPKSVQIRTFYKEMLSQGLSETNEKPKDWIDIFFMLRKLIESKETKRKVVILDEAPWMDTQGSGFVSALEHFWNSWASSKNNIVLVICGSATSWMVNTLFNNHGGLYNRITSRLFLQPFTLTETESFIKSRGVSLSRYEIAELYMIMGGIPFYLEMISNTLSLSQNIDRLFFQINGLLRTEFNNLYDALFKNSNDYISVVRALSTKKSGLTRGEIVKETGLQSGGGLSKILENLVSCGFVRVFKNYLGKRGNVTFFQLVDFYTLFYFQFINNKEEYGEGYWSSIQNTAALYNWTGISFEILCITHVEMIKKKLGISGVMTREYALRMQDEHGGTQIDLVIDRADNTVNLCEMKFSVAPYSITKDYEINLRNKISKLMQQPHFRKSIRMTFVTTFGVERNIHSGIINDEVILDNLFE